MGASDVEGKWERVMLREVGTSDVVRGMMNIYWSLVLLLVWYGSDGDIDVKCNFDALNKENTENGQQ